MLAFSVLALAMSLLPSALGAAIDLEAVAERDAAGELTKRAAAAMTSAQISSYTPYIRLAGAAYCSPSSTKAWNCGANCNALPGFVTTASGGDGQSTQFWYVGWYPSLSSVVVGYQGTDPSEVESVLVDADYFLDPLNGTFFPGASSSAETHGGFGNAFDRSAASVYSAVVSTLNAHPGATVAVVGHSLGGALAQHAAVSLKLRLPSARVKYVGFGVPRVGNPAWASLVDSLVPDTAHINNKKDIVPIVPGRFLGFAHPSGEKHIATNGTWLACNGQDSTETGCTIDQVPNVFVASVGDHSGPYNGINIGC